MPAMPSAASAEHAQVARGHVAIEDARHRHQRRGQPRREPGAPCGSPCPTGAASAVDGVAGRRQRAGRASRSGWSAARLRQTNSSTPSAPRTMFGSQTASHGGRCGPWPSPGPPEHDVVDEDDADADDEAGQLAVAAVGGAERQADQAEHQARHRDRELLVDRHQLVVRRQSLPASSAARARSSAMVISLSPLGGALLGNTDSGFRLRQHAIEREHLVLPVRIRGVARAVFEHHFDRRLLAVDEHAPVPGQVDGRATRCGCRP